MRVRGIRIRYLEKPNWRARICARSTLIRYSLLCALYLSSLAPCTCCRRSLQASRQGIPEVFRNRLTVMYTENLKQQKMQTRMGCNNTGSVAVVSTTPIDLRCTVASTETPTVKIQPGYAHTYSIIQPQPRAASVGYIYHKYPAFPRSRYSGQIRKYTQEVRGEKLR